MEINLINNYNLFSKLKNYINEEQSEKPIVEEKNNRKIKLSYSNNEAFLIELNNFSFTQKLEINNWVKEFEKEEDINKLIYGKDNTQRIVSMEVHDKSVELFIENSNGSITNKFIPNNNWICTPEPANSNSVKLKGDLHYKYITYIDELEKFEKIRKKMRKDQGYTSFDNKETFMLNSGVTYFKGMKIEDVSVLAFDIEATTLELNSKAKVLLISNTFRRNGKIERKLFSYDNYKDHGELFTSWTKWVREKNPSIILGHNIFNYDLPYLNYCAKREGVTLDLGRDNSSIKFNKYPSKFRKDGSQFYNYVGANVYGRELIDTMFLSIKYDISRKYENYGLKQIIKQENLEVKDRQFYDASQIRFNYENPIEWEKIKKYAIHDADDSLALFDLMVPSYFYLCQSIPKSFQQIINGASGSQLNSLMVRSYLQDGHSLPKATNVKEFEGAISYGVPGVYKNCFKQDVSSLYPSIIRQYKIYDKVKDPKEHLLKITNYFTEQRLKHKHIAKETGDKYYSDLEQSEKICINSLYGFLGAPGLLFNSPENASLVTQRGREILQKAILWASGKEYIKVEEND